MSHHRTQGKDLIAGQPFGGNGIQGSIIFSIAKDGLLGAATIIVLTTIFVNFMSKDIFSLVCGKLGNEDELF
jgi:hypothetical protein